MVSVPELTVGSVSKLNPASEKTEAADTGEVMLVAPGHSAEVWQG